MRIAICDDDGLELAHISTLLNRYQKTKDAAFRCDAFSSVIELLEAAKRQPYDVFLLDVLMPGTTGIEAAREIRAFDSTAKIIFLTASAEFAVDSYAVDAHYYLLKPCTEETLFPVLDRLFLQVRRSEETLFIPLSSGFLRLPFASIEFLEVQQKRLLFHLTSGSTKEIAGALKDFEERLLCRKEFIKVHRSYLVNLDYVSSATANEMVMETNQRVPISRLLSSKVREAYLQYLFLERSTSEQR